MFSCGILLPLLVCQCGGTEHGLGFVIAMSYWLQISQYHLTFQVWVGLPKGFSL